jgi:hypothetical protein
VTPPLNVRRVSDIAVEEVRWLWHPYVPLGKVTIAEGDPGVGKSWFSLAAAASLSRGVGLPGDGAVCEGATLVFSAEDGAGDTIRPRLERMGADLDRVFVVDDPVLLDGNGLAQLRDACTVYRPTLIVLDPLVAFLGSEVDIHRANEVRAVLAPLGEIASGAGAAVLAIRHLNKGQGRVLYRGLGSIDLTAAARSVLLFGKAPNDPTDTQRAIVHIKSNLAKCGPALGFRLDEDGFTWTGRSDLTADDLLRVEVPQPRRDVAVQFIEDELADGPKPASEVLAAASRWGIAPATLKRAKAQAGVLSSRAGGFAGEGEWIWSLAEESR